MVGALVKRYQWFKFRNCFNGFRMHPIMDNQAYWQQGNKTDEESDARENPSGNSRVFRFTGEFESITDKQVLWVRGENLIVPVSLKNAETYFLPIQNEENSTEISDPGEEAPEKIRWDRISSFAEGTKVFVGGSLSCQEGRWSFVSTKESPLMVIFYDGPDHSLAIKTTWAGRHRGEYFNLITPYSLITGAVCLLFIAALFLPRPAFLLTVIVSLVAVFIPLLPLMPPGLLFTVIYRHLAWKSRILRTYSDLAKLPLGYFDHKNDNSPLRGKRTLPNGEIYGFVYSAKLPSEVQDGKIPLLIPDITGLGRGDNWYVFGAVRPSELLPFRPKDPFATFGVLPGNPRKFAHRCTVKAYVLEAVAWVMLFSGIALNIFFLMTVLLLLI